MTTAGALVQALTALRVRRVALVTPYIDALNSLLVAFLDVHGIETVASSGLGLLGQIWRVSDEELVDSARAVDRPEADAIFISCTNLTTYDLIAPLERELGKPVITANQVTMWAALRMLGLHATGPGQWLVERAPLTVLAVAPVTASPLPRSNPPLHRRPRCTRSGCGCPTSRGAGPAQRGGRHGWWRPAAGHRSLPRSRPAPRRSCAPWPRTRCTNRIPSR